MEPEVRSAPVRYYEIDLLRFMAALAVVLFHFTFRGFHGDHLSPVEYPVLGSVFKYGYLGVEFFFIISGYVVLLSAQGKTLAQFFTSRVMRLFPAYWVVCTLCFVVVRLFGPAVHAPGWSPLLDAPLKAYLYSMTMLQTFFGVPNLDGVYWTLAYEISFYFLIALLLAFGWLRRTEHVLWVLAGWLAYCALVGPATDTNAFSFLLFPRYAPFFIAGMVFYLLQTSQAARWKLYTLLGAAYALGLQAAFSRAAENARNYTQPFSLVVVTGLFTLFFVVFLLIIYRKINLGQAKWAAFVGALTYPLYLAHHSMGYVLLQWLGPHVDKYVLLVGLLALFMGLAYLLHISVERRYSKALGQRVQGLLARLGASAQRPGQGADNSPHPRLEGAQR
jgi:peptidoglycan/LPS O-acetylase OafA/YrhL